MNLKEALRITSGITSGVTDAEAELLYRLAARAHERNTGSVVEIGAYMGKSAIILAATGRVFSIDHHRGNTEHQPGQPRCRPGTVVDGRVDTYPIFRRNIEAAVVAHNVVPVITDHLTALSCLRQSVLPVAVLFVDAEHSYDATMSITQTWVPRVHGTVLFHDYCLDFPNVIRAVDDAKLGKEVYQVDTIVGFDVKPVATG